MALSTVIRRSALAAGLFILVSGAQAATVIYDWVPNAGQGGMGSIELSSTSITDPANFSGIPANALTALSYTWDNGAAIDLSTILTNNVTTWEASGGFLINGFQITAGSLSGDPGTFSLALSAGLPGNPGPGFNSTNSVAFGAEGNAGQWVLNPIPVPAAVWLFASGLGLLGWVRSRRG